MKRFKIALAGGVALWAGAAQASPLLLEYDVAASATAGVYNYAFRLTLDNHDGSWAAGQQWDWIIFGDRPGSSGGLADFFNGASPDPLVGFTFSGGGHNGPTISYGAGGVTLPGWQPAAVGAALSWSGQSHTFLGAGALQWSTIIYNSGAVPENFATATLTPGLLSPVPEPATWAMMIGGFGLVGGAMRRKSKAPAVRYA